MITIRKANRGNVQGAWQIRNAAISSQCVSHYSSEVLTLWTQGEIPERFIKEVENDFYVATIDGQMVGMGMINLESGKIDGIFVHPNHMGMGVGTHIISHLESLAHSRGLTQLNLESTLNAAPFYRSCGFTGNKVVQYDTLNGTSVECILMTKNL